MKRTALRLAQEGVHERAEVRTDVPRHRLDVPLDGPAIVLFRAHALVADATPDIRLPDSGQVRVDVEEEPRPPGGAARLHPGDEGGEELPVEPLHLVRPAVGDAVHAGNVLLLPAPQESTAQDG